MPAIESEGNYTVKITQALYKDTPKDDDKEAFCITLKGETPDGFHAWANLYFSHKVIGGGKNAGKTMFEAQTELLKSLGVPDGYLGALNDTIEKGMEAEFNMQNEVDDKGNMHLRVKYINPARTSVDVSDINWAEKLAAFEGKQVQADATATTPASQPQPQAQTQAQPQQMPTVQTPAPMTATTDDGDPLPF